MKVIISALIVLIPCIAGAATDCQVVEYPDHNEVICVGDEKAPASVTQKTAKKQEPSPQSEPSLKPESPERAMSGSATNDTSSATAPPPADIPTRDQSVIPTTPIPSRGPGAVIVNRQGRANQASQSALQDAISARRALIMEHSQAPTDK